MSKMLRSIPDMAWATIGHCSRCTRKAFLAAISSWATALVLAICTNWTYALILAVALSIGLTALWMAHLLAFASKFTHNVSVLQPDLFNSSRRAFFPIFAKTLAFATVASSVPRLALAIEAPPGWKPIGAGLNAKPIIRVQGRCQPVTYGCNSCCNNNISGNLYVNADCSSGCSMGCGSQQCY
jgi:hypothetical protein